MAQGHGHLVKLKKLPLLPSITKFLHSRCPRDLNLKYTKQKPDCQPAYSVALILNTHLFTQSFNYLGDIHNFVQNIKQKDQTACLATPSHNSTCFMHQIIHIFPLLSLTLLVCLENLSESLLDF